MSYGGNQQANPRYMLNPSNLLFKFFQSQTTCVIWLQENKNKMLEGCIAGYDEFLNIVIDDAVEILVNKVSTQERKLGKIMLKGDNECCFDSDEGWRQQVRDRDHPELIFQD